MNFVGNTNTEPAAPLLAGVVQGYIHLRLGSCPVCIYVARSADATGEGSLQVCWAKPTSWLLSPVPVLRA